MKSIYRTSFPTQFKLWAATFHTLLEVCHAAETTSFKGSRDGETKHLTVTVSIINLNFAFMAINSIVSIQLSLSSNRILEQNRDCNIQNLTQVYYL